MRADSSPARRSLATGRLTRRGALTGFAGLAIAATGLGVAGCTSTKPPPTDAEVLARDPLGPMYAETKQLIEQYDGAMAAAPALAGVLGPLREEHRQHLIALASLINIPAPTISATANASGVPLPSGPGSTPPVHPTPSGTSPQGPSSVGPTGAGQTTGPPASAPGSGSGSASDATATRAALSAAESTAQRNAVAACLSAPTNRVAVLASIAACLATHVAALR